MGGHGRSLETLGFILIEALRAGQEVDFVRVFEAVVNSIGALYETFLDTFGASRSPPPYSSSHGCSQGLPGRPQMHDLGRGLRFIRLSLAVHLAHDR